MTIEEWAEDFKSFVNELQMPRDDYKGIMLYIDDALTLLKEQDGYVSVPFSWLVKFCTHIDFKEPVTDEERELLWKQKLKQQFGIELEGES